MKITVMKKLPQFHCSFRTWISGKGDKLVLPHLYTYKETLGIVLTNWWLSIKKKKKEFCGVPKADETCYKGKVADG